MCEYCHQYKHHSLCPNAPDPPIRDKCLQCDEDLREDYTYWIDEDGNKFCSDDCAMEYHDIKEKEWE